MRPLPRAATLSSSRVCSTSCSIPWRRCGLLVLPQWPRAAIGAVRFGGTLDAPMREIVICVVRCRGQTARCYELESADGDRSVPLLAVFDTWVPAPLRVMEV